MIGTDKDALVCDLAETYRIFDYRSLPLQTVATLSVGLRNNSRIKMKICEQNYTLDELLMASMVDKLSVLIWMQTKDGAKGIHFPKLIVDEMLAKEKTEEDKPCLFASGEEFERARAQILKEGLYG